MNIRTGKTIQERRVLVEKERGVSLSSIGHFSLDEAVASTRNCENMIGVTQIPLGIAGPLLISSANYQLPATSYVIPLATTEGALVASVSRGCKAIGESGGADVEVEDTGATRGPVFRVGNIKEGRKFEDFLKNNFSQLQEVAAQTSRHIVLKAYTVSGAGVYRFVRFSFDTKDAMGLNMVTIATTALASYIVEAIHIPCVDISGNFCVDKKPSWFNFIQKRGKAVRAEITMPVSVVGGVLKTTPQKFYEAWLAKCMMGSAMSGSMGFNAQFANILAALFIATGQDPAHVAECSIGMTTTEITSNGDLYVGVYLPDLMVGTVGGGTGLATQKEALELLGVSGGNDGKNAVVLAGVIGAAVLAGELSLLASLAQGSLARAHESLARGKVRQV